ncbi:hypothetical protein BJ878DRAFT_490612 [Calycina marina]|uniref:Peroxin-5 n=1 Tax=Calycina marina TaxID=1763456 RepID=A0A9P8CIH2_9HELO|nr:hypothetical protein BJ878DRAFT_490612 [Calycina marina]
MALCASSHEPLSQFSKHFQDDGGLYRDRLTPYKRTEGHGFRSAGQGQGDQAASDFLQYTDSHIAETGLMLPPELLQHVYRATELKSTRGSAAAEWLSEYQAGSNRMRYNDGQQPVRPANFNGALKPKLEVADGKHAYTNQHRADARSYETTSQWLQPNANHPFLHFSHHTSTLDWNQRNSSTQHEEHSMNGIHALEWETVFSSLEKETQASPAVYQSCSNSDGLGSSLQNSAVCSHEPPDLLSSHATDYRFQDDNPFSGFANPFGEGIRIIENDGNLSVAALAFEAACEANPLHFEAWRKLGSVLSEVEREDTAIEAFNEALRLDPSNLDVIMRLAISHTNEGSSGLAYNNLENWLKTKYPQITIPELRTSSVLSTSRELLDRIKEPYLQAARLSATSGVDFDLDVQVGLGVLLFSAKEYQLAADCFSTAIQFSVPGSLNADSQLHLLWNRYGACLGNMNRYEEAIEAYEMALAIRPSFVRARYNLGLLYYNRNEPGTAAKTILEALMRGNVSDTNARADMMKIVKVSTSHGRLEVIIQRGEPVAMYETLRKCCSSLFRWDLVEAVGPSMDLHWFQQELDRL